MFVEDGRADGSLLLDAIEAADVAFRRRLRSIDQATSCDIRLHGLWRLLGPMFATEGKAGPERELRRLKAQVEQPA